MEIRYFNGLAINLRDGGLTLGCRWYFVCNFGVGSLVLSLYFCITIFLKFVLIGKKLSLSFKMVKSC